MSSEMYYCSLCDKVFKLSGPGKKAKCPHCSNMLLDMGIVGEEYAKLDKQHKDELKIKTKSVLSQKDTPYSKENPAENAQVSAYSSNKVTQTSLSDTVPDKDLNTDKQMSIPQESESKSDLDGNAILASDSKAPSSPSTQKFSFFDSDEVKKEPVTSPITTSINNEKQTPKSKKRDENKQPKTALKVLICIAAVLVLTIGGLTVYAFVINPSVLSLFRAEETPKPAETVIAEESEAEPEVIEDVVEEEPEVIEEEPESEKQDTTYARLYLGLIKKLYSDNKADKFALVNIDDDDIPELIAVNSNGQEQLDEDCFLYTIYDNNTVLISSSYIQYLKISYSERKNIIYTGGGDIGFYVTFNRIEQGKLDELLSAEFMPGFDNTIGEPISTYLINSEETTETKYYEEVSKYFSQYNPFTKIDTDGLHIVTYEKNDMYDMYHGNEINIKPYMSYDDIIAELNKLVPDNETTAWANIYLDYLSSVDIGEFNHAAMIYVNDDLTPEIILESHSDENFTDYSSYWGLTINANEVEKIELYGDHAGLEYIPNDNSLYLSYLILQGGYITDTVSSIKNGKWYETFNGKNGAGMDPEGTVEFFIDETEVNEKDYNQKLKSAFDTSKAQTVDFNLSIDELKEELKRIRSETNAEKYKDEEPWKTAYIDYLYGVLAGVNPLFSPHEASYYDESYPPYFSLKDITDDGTPELWIGGDNSGWNVLTVNKQNKAEFIDSEECFVSFYDPKNKRIYAHNSGIFEHYTLYTVVNGKIVKQYTLDEGDSEEITYYRNDDEITKEEMDKYDKEYDEASKKYPLNLDIYELTKENIDKILR